MLSNWSIRDKLLLGTTFLLLIVGTLSVSGIISVTSYRQLVRTVSDRAEELPLAEQVTRSVDDLRHAVNDAYRWRNAVARQRYDELPPRKDLRVALLPVREALSQYQRKLSELQPHGSGIADIRDEWETARKIQRMLERIETVHGTGGWVLDEVDLDLLRNDVEELRTLADSLPRFLQARMQDLHGNVRGQYHTLIALTWTTSVLATLLLFLLVKLFYDGVFRPLNVLIRGSRRVAAGDFDYRIHLESQDEMAELAAALNDMTSRFQSIREDLDQQVKQRTKEVVRKEQLASVGFLAAGVAHEINNPLASIAWCAEALESRLHDILYSDETLGEESAASDLDVLRRYLRRIQDEAFRCKGITEKLLDFSRMGDTTRHQVELCELVQDVIDMVKHLGRYRNKRLDFIAQRPVMALANPQEIKQVVLNLVTNALDSIDANGRVEVEVDEQEAQAILVFRDDGCGMSEEVQEHLFEPFFTRRRDGQGTGLGLSIAYRIVADHGGTIDAFSDGEDKGAVFRVTLPLASETKDHEQDRQVA